MNKLKTIAILSKNDALASILRMVLADNCSFRVRIFSDEISLLKYMQILPIDLLIYDCSLFDHEIATSVSYLRDCNSANKQFQTIVLCKDIVASISPAKQYAKINEIIIKPMSPLYIEERVGALLGANLSKLGANLSKNNGWQKNKADILQKYKEKQTPALYGDNVISIFDKKFNSNRNPSNHDNYIE